MRRLFYVRYCCLFLTNRKCTHIIKEILIQKYVISYDEDEVLRALLNREQTDQLQPSPESLFASSPRSCFPEKHLRIRGNRRASVTVPKVWTVFLYTFLPVEVVHRKMYNEFGWYHGSSTFRPSCFYLKHEGRKVFLLF